MQRFLLGFVLIHIISSEQGEQKIVFQHFFVSRVAGGRGVEEKSADIVLTI